MILTDYRAYIIRRDEKICRLFDENKFEHERLKTLHEFIANECHVSVFTVRRVLDANHRGGLANFRN